MKLESFHTREELFKAALKFVTDKLPSEGKALLSGGLTPVPLYQLFSERMSQLKRVQWGLVDERYVPTSDENSNERMIRKALGPEVDLTGMVCDPHNYELNLGLVNQAYRSFVEHTDLCILGMGNDGHTASVFPGDSVSEEILANTEVGIFNTSAPTHPERRVTCSPEMLIKSTFMLILIIGKEKKNVLLNETLNLPIHKVLARRPDCVIYYAD